MPVFLVEIREKNEGISVPVVLYTDLQLIPLFSDPCLTLFSITSVLLHPFGVSVARLGNSGLVVPI